MQPSFGIISPRNFNKIIESVVNIGIRLCLQLKHMKTHFQEVMFDLKGKLVPSEFSI